MQVTLIHNPQAGDRNQPSGDVLAGLIRQAGYEVNYQSSQADNWQAALDQPSDLVVAAGGDGTIGKVAKCLIRQRLPMAILPLGTANNIAKTLGLKDVPLEQLIETWATGRRIALDGAIATGAWGSTYLIESLGLGLFVNTMAVAKDSNTLHRLDNANDKLTMALKMLHQQLAQCPAQSLTVVLDGQDISGNYLLLEAMNIRYVGPNLYLAPDAVLDDGLLNVVVLRDGEQAQMADYLADCLAGQLYPAPVTLYRGKHLQIQGEGFDLHLDDQLLSSRQATPHPDAAVEVKVDPHALEFLLPAPW
jgi:diacylglycerol kinase (ATP)